MEQTDIKKPLDLNEAFSVPHRVRRGGFGPVVLFSMGSVTFVTFGAYVGLGALLALLHTGIFLGATGGLPDAQTLNQFSLLIAFGIPVSAYLITRLLDIPAWLRGEKSFTEYLRTVSFGLWGGLIGGMLIIILFTRMNHISGLHLLDAAVLGLPLGQAFGRWGCLNYGCCHGREVKKRGQRFTIRYTDPLTKILRYSPHLSGKPVYPTQIYSVIVNLLIYAGLMTVWLRWPAQPVGFLAALYMLGYGGKRFFIEFFRGEFPRVMLSGLSLWQWLSLGFIMAGTILVITVIRTGSIAVAPDYAGGWLMLQQTWPALILAALVMGLMYGIHGRKIGAW